MVAIHILRILLFESLALAVPAPWSSLSSSTANSAQDAKVLPAQHFVGGIPSVPADFPIASPFSQAKMIDRAEAAAAMPKGVESAQRVSLGVSANGAQLLESVSGAFWGVYTGGSPSNQTGGKAEVATSFSTTSRPVSKRTVYLPALTHCLATYRKQSNLEYITPTYNRNTWKEYATPYNLRIKAGADIIVLARTINHVQEAVKCALEHKTPVQARAGGHSFGGYSSATQGGMVVDLRYLGDVRYEESSGVAIVEGGIRIGQWTLA